LYFADKKVEQQIYFTDLFNSRRWIMLKRYGIKLMLLTICCAVVFIAGSKVFAYSSYQDGSQVNAKIIMCASGSDEDKEAVIDDDDKGAQKDIDKNAIIDGDSNDKDSSD
jgi:hypothetical protein